MPRAEWQCKKSDREKLDDAFVASIEKQESQAAGKILLFLILIRYIVSCWNGLQHFLNRIGGTKRESRDTEIGASLFFTSTVSSSTRHFHLLFSVGVPSIVLFHSVASLDAREAF